MCASTSDSSSEAKFSRHLIFNMPHAVFVDNQAAGAFVRHLVRIMQTRADHTWTVKSEDGSQEILFVDSSMVCTRTLGPVHVPYPLT